MKYKIIVSRGAQVALALSLSFGVTLGAARANSTLTIVNYTALPIIDTQVAVANGADWLTDSPARNFQHLTIPVGTSVSRPENPNPKAKSARFTMTLTLQGGSTVSFVGDQSDASKPLFTLHDMQQQSPNTYGLIQFSSGKDYNKPVQFAGLEANNFVLFTRYGSTNWMSALPGDRQISLLTVPGTHDTATWKTSNPIARTQGRDLAQQLNDGIRFWDIRVRPVPDNQRPGQAAWALVHGIVYLDQNFDDALDAISKFLRANPSETVIVSIKDDQSPMGGTPSWSMAKIFRSYQDRRKDVPWYTGATYPSLETVRGKAVLLRRFKLEKSDGNAVLGINAEQGWKDDKTFNIINGNQYIRVQDEYKSTGRDKIKAVEKQMSQAHDITSGQSLFINFTSSNALSCGFNPNHCAEIVMPANLVDCSNFAGCVMFQGVSSYPVRVANPARLGIMPMDFYEKYNPLVSLLIGMNAMPPANRGQ